MYECQVANWDKIGYIRGSGHACACHYLWDMRSEIKDLFHPPVSRMGKDALIRYVYMTAKHLGWKWTQLEGLAQSRRQPKGCHSGKAPGASAEPPARSKRKPSAYNKFVQRHMASNTDGTVQERFSDVVKAWKSSAVAGTTYMHCDTSVPRGAHRAALRRPGTWRTVVAVAWRRCTSMARDGHTRRRHRFKSIIVQLCTRLYNFMNTLY
eukprot:COSAG02_NODE_7605_length_2937_cov_2.178999_1_plen_209_part_00